MASTFNVHEASGYDQLMAAGAESLLQTSSSLPASPRGRESLTSDAALAV